ncbi:hypothetical protein AGLY_009530 [Aphis glycines]|uniref:15-hydroxyprostaglandin dehydrogenase [NAD(+)] n=1 Tax=Aphis glycines TaxID=307491 RepID=A0A6G0THV6_APHGL|nr:hypothetical protein AGLY_009530 [Aphis glycines]
MPCEMAYRSSSAIILPYYYRKNYTTVPSSSPSCPLKQYMEVEGKCALVVDGTSGVGHAFADELLKMNAAKVIITGLNGMKGAETAREFNKIYGQARVDFYQTDVGNPLEIKKTHEGEDDMIATNFNSKIHGIILATKNMKEGSVIVNHTSAIGLNPNSDMIAHSAASTGFLVASMAFSKNQYFKKTKIRMTTLCSELFPSTFVGGTVPPITCDCQEAQRNIEISIAKSAAYLVKHGSNNTLWLCQQNGILSMVELQKIVEFTEKYEPRIIIDDQHNPGDELGDFCPIPFRPQHGYDQVLRPQLFDVDFRASCSPPILPRITFEECVVGVVWRCPALRAGIGLEQAETVQVVTETAVPSQHLRQVERYLTSPNLT